MEPLVNKGPGIGFDVRTFIKTFYTKGDHKKSLDDHDLQIAVAHPRNTWAPSSSRIGMDYGERRLQICAGAHSTQPVVVGKKIKNSWDEVPSYGRVAKTSQSGKELEGARRKHKNSSAFDGRAKMKFSTPITKSKVGKTLKVTVNDSSSEDSPSADDSSSEDSPSPDDSSSEDSASADDSSSKDSPSADDSSSAFDFPYSDDSAKIPEEKRDKKATDRQNSSSSVTEGDEDSLEVLEKSSADMWEGNQPENHHEINSSMENLRGEEHP